MNVFTISGGRPLEGSLTIHGAKNSVLPILAATVLCPGVTTIQNCPPLSDVTASLTILTHLGCRVTQEGDTVTVDASTLTRQNIPDSLMREMRSSVLFLGSILGRTGQVSLSYPGGCELGPRPIDLHLDALRTLGAEIREGPEGLICGAAQLHGGSITLPLPSVGATENAILAAVSASGVTTITNAAREPEILDLQRFLCALGARVSGAGGSVITIQGGLPLHGGTYRVMGDRIVACTYLAAAAAAGGEIELFGVDPIHLVPVTDLFQSAGCEIRTGERVLHLTRRGPLHGGTTIRTAPYPGFPTDAQAPVMASLCGAQGTTLFVETVFQSRYRHVDELTRMGAEIRTEGRVAVLTGVPRLHGAHVRAHDLRGGAALVVAGLGAEGVTTVEGLEHIDRGYFRLEDDLRRLGAEIQRIDKGASDCGVTKEKKAEEA